MFYFLVYPILFLVSLLPMQILYVFSDIIYYLAFYIIRYRRKLVTKNLKKSFPEKHENEIKLEEKKFYHFFCDVIFENIKALSASNKFITSHMRFADIDVIERELEKKMFAFVYLGHYCNWEYIASLPWNVDGGIKCSQLYTTIHNKTIDKIMYKLRTRFGGECINKKIALRRILQMKKENNKHIIGFIADQGPKKENIHLWLEFLNQKTPVFTGVERIARKVDATIFYADVTRISRGVYQCRFVPITNNINSIDEFQATTLFMQKLEDKIKQEPSFWLWSHNRWKRNYLSELIK